MDDRGRTVVSPLARHDEPMPVVLDRLDDWRLRFRAHDERDGYSSAQNDDGNQREEPPGFHQRTLIVIHQRQIGLMPNAGMIAWSTQYKGHNHQR